MGGGSGGQVKIQYNIAKEDLVAPCRWWAGLASPSPPAVMVRSSSSSSVEILFFLFAKESSCTSTFLERIFERQTWIQFKTKYTVLHQRLNQMKKMSSIQFKAQSMDWMSVSRENIFKLKIVSRVFMLYKIQPRGIIKIRNDETQQGKIYRCPQLVLKKATI